MEDIENLVRVTLGEIEKMLNTKTVVGEPINIEGKIMIPLISIGFGFGAAGGSGKGSLKQVQEGSGGGTFGGVGIRPTAVIISDERGIRIEQVRGSLGSSLEKIIQTVSPLIQSRKNKGEPDQSQENDGEK
ncbi:MAG: hypothetical protein JXA46_01490 [Dehalococcoidales bacterium]|nr:hypothetical protein [Dehalococcoidales bacterium]